MTGASGRFRSMLRRRLVLVLLLAAAAAAVAVSGMRAAEPVHVMPDGTTMPASQMR
jgi:hypothetical protein